MQLHQWFTMMLFRTIAERLTKIEETIDKELHAANAGILEQRKREQSDVDPSDWIEANILQSQTRLAFFVVLVAHFEPLLLNHTEPRKDGKKYVADVWANLRKSHPQVNVDGLRALFEVRHRLLHDGFIWNTDLAAIETPIGGLTSANFDDGIIDVADDFVKRVADFFADAYRAISTDDSPKSPSPITPEPLIVHPRPHPQ